MSSIITSSTWKDLPPEIWLNIFNLLPMRSQVSLGCSCKKLYEFSLDRLLGNAEKRAELYLEKKQPLPALLARSVRVFNGPSIVRNAEEWRQHKEFFKGEILRMINLQKLILEMYPYARTHEIRYKGVFAEKEVHDFFACANLEELLVPPSYLGHKIPSGKTLLHSAVESGNIKVTESILSQLEADYHNELGENWSFPLPAEINTKDKQGNTPLKLALHRRDEKMVSLLLRYGARGDIYRLWDRSVSKDKAKKPSKKREDLSLFAGENMSYGAHLYVKAFSAENQASFFAALTENRTLISLELAEDFFESWGNDVNKRSLFFQELAAVCQKNSQILLIDLSGCLDLTSQEIKPFLECRGLEELLLPSSLLYFVDDSSQNLLHWAVSAQNKKIINSFVNQGIGLSQKDVRGDTPAGLARSLPDQEIVSFLEKAAREKLAKIAFGKKDWERYYGKIGKEPPLPPNILEILESPCPFWTGQRVHETHFFVLIPKMIDDEPFTWHGLGKMTSSSTEGRQMSMLFSGGGWWREQHASPSRWVLFTKDVLPNTQTGASSERQQTCYSLTARIPSTPGLGQYRSPKSVEAIACIFTEYKRSGRRYYREKDRACTFCTPTDWEYGGSEMVGLFSEDQIYFHKSTTTLIGDAGYGMLREVRGSI